MTIETINTTIQNQKQQLLQHSLYEKVQTLDDLHCFLESHVYAVWDFMSLLKALQSKLTCTTTPWFATPNSEMRYLINEIVVAEESDLKKLIYYFERHIELDADEHGPMAMQMISELCGDDAVKWEEVKEISILALEKRIGLWNAIEEKITMNVAMA